MATIRDRQVIFDEMLTRNLNFYKVLDSDNKTLLTAQQDKDCTATEAEKSLREFLDKLDGIVYVVLSAKAGDEINNGGNIKNQTFKYQLKLGDSASVPGINGTGGGNSIGAMTLAIEQVEAKMEAKMEAMKKDFEHQEQIRKLKDEIKELKDGDQIKEKGFAMLEQLLAQGTTPGVTGFNNSEANPGITGITGPGTPTERTLRLQAAIKKINSVDKDYLEHLEMLADIAINKPLVYAEAIRKLATF